MPLLLICIFILSLQSTFADRLTEAAIDLTEDRVVYDPSYYSIAYPGGDVPADRGVCTDVVIRAYRKLGIDLQVLVHEDMRKAFHTYPKTWGLKRPDTNIDHRRVPNLMTFFKRHGESLPISASQKDYKRGEIITWDLGGNVPHIGIVVGEGTKVKIVHNIGAGQVMESCLFDYQITGRFRFEPEI